jgi:CRP-like cAMP-binding protein
MASTTSDRPVFVGGPHQRYGRGDRRDATSEYYVVIDGEVEIRGEGYGADQTVLRLGPGKFFGDQATLRGQRGALTCHAVTRSILLAVDRTALRDLQSGQV